VGKNMWKFDCNRGHHFQARDDFGQPYQAKWGKLNLGACIQQASCHRRGEHSLYEAVTYRLFNLAGVPAIADIGPSRSNSRQDKSEQLSDDPGRPR
jgi:hypothetical protein